MAEDGLLKLVMNNEQYYSYDETNITIIEDAISELIEGYKEYSFADGNRR